MKCPYCKNPIYEDDLIDNGMTEIEDEGNYLKCYFFSPCPHCHKPIPCVNIFKFESVKITTEEDA